MNCSFLSESYSLIQTKDVHLKGFFFSYTNEQDIWLTNEIFVRKLYFNFLREIDFKCLSNRSLRYLFISFLYSKFWQIKIMHIYILCISSFEGKRKKNRSFSFIHWYFYFKNQLNCVVMIDVWYHQLKVEQYFLELENLNQHSEHRR